ncbi:hypothetical protein [Streptomyces sp. Amel2xC10]|uniref:hypothetical protein n=1 Tax=Streptomyces sp. Amel2xC10 TaxID=1305826 RepID=UPI000A08F567|nr:hypothetical protein [Streptomyces sp. Amel2xC10]SMF86122.1 hypothetical protein SAMN02745830_07128 [Streptomyces sp. Amel2xC10]
MRLSEAKARVEREHPELTGTAKVEAIKALREQAAAQEAKEAPVAGLPQCARCEQFVKPRRPGAAAGLLGFLALYQLAAVAVAVVALAGGPRPGRGGIFVMPAVWPALIDPAWLGLAAAVVALVVVVGLANAAGERARRRAVCPHCEAPMPDVSGG